MKLSHPKGREVDVPEDKVEYYTSKGWAVDVVVAEPDTVTIPDGDPSKDWTAAQLDALAERDGIDLTGSKGNKGDRLDAIAAHRDAAAKAAASAGETGTAGETGK